MVEDKPRSSVDRVHDEIAVGTNMEFERKWWRLERTAWTVMVILLIAGFVGLFGRGPLATANAQSSDGALTMRYEHFERYRTPAKIAVTLKGAGVRNHAALLWVSDSLLKQLGNQRVSPQPAVSELGGDHTLYAFPVHDDQARVEFTLEPERPGVFDVVVGVFNGPELHRQIIVWP